jgi:hypothetical protein
MAWRDTALVLPGGYIDILVDMSNPGEWMMHCHIVEHLFAGMMLQFRVEDKDKFAPGDEFRRSLQTAQPQATGASSQTYTFDSTVENVMTVTSDKPKYAVGQAETVSFSFKDQNGNGIMLDPTKPVALTATFVSKSGKDHFVSYPGNTAIYNRGGMMNTNVPGSPGFNESMPHSHSFNIPSFVSVAYADAGHAHNGVAPTNFVPTYSVPAYFMESGEYKVFVEFYVPGDPKPFISSVTLNVGTVSWNIDSYNWTGIYLGKTSKWWILLIISLILMVPLSRYVNRYINVQK